MVPFPELSAQPTPIEYFWYKLPFAVPGIITFFVGIILAGLGIFAVKRTQDRPLLVSFILFTFGFGSLGLVLALRSLIQDLDQLLFWNRLLYFAVVWLSPGAFLFTYFLTDRIYRGLLITGVIGILTVFFAYYGLITGNDFSGEWFSYTFGMYPIAELPLKAWGAVASIGYLLSGIPMTIHYVTKNREKYETKKGMFLGLHLCSLLVITNLPSLTGIPIYPMSSFAFLPLLLMGFFIFRSDFLNLNQLLFEKNGLFRFLSAVMITGLIAISLCSGYFLNPSIHPTPYDKPYFLIPLFSAACVFALAIYIAGSSPDQKINMLAATSLVLAGAFTIVMVIFKLDISLLVCRRLEQIFYTAFIFTPGLHLRFSFVAMGKPRPKIVRFVDFCSFLLSFLVWTPYFFDGFYFHSFGIISAAGWGLNAFGILGGISAIIFIYHWNRQRLTEQNPMAKYVIFSLLFGDVLIILNLPATLGIDFYPLGEFQFIPALLILFAILKFSAITVSGEAATIGNQMSQMILLFVPLNLTFYFMSLNQDFSWMVSLFHILLVGAPIGLSFYMISFIFFRPTAMKLDETIKLIAEEKKKTDVALLESERQKKETIALNELIRSLNEELNIESIMKKVHKYVKEQFGIQYYTLLVADSEKKFLRVHSCVLPNIDMEIVRKRVFEFSIPIRGSRGSHAMAIRRKKPLYISEVSKEMQSWMRDFDLWIIETFRVNSFLYLPLLLNKEVVGMIDFTNSDEKMNLSEDDIVRLSILGEQLAGILYSSALYKEVEISHNIAEEERRKNEKLLLNILPADIAKELKEKGATEPVLYENVSVMFTDFKGFTQIAEILSPQELIRDLDECFIQFDRITERFRLEKLKTIGDSYMCAGGIPKQNKTHAIDTVLAALEIQTFMKTMKEMKSAQGLSFWELRLGIHSGPLVAGVIGEKKFAYDVWGDTVNSASRMESSGTPGMINISGSTFKLIKDVFDCEFRGKLNAKNKGEVEMYYVIGLKSQFASLSDPRVPNEKFWHYYSELENSIQMVS